MAPQRHYIDFYAKTPADFYATLIDCFNYIVTTRARPQEFLRPSPADKFRRFLSAFYRQIILPDMCDPDPVLRFDVSQITRKMDVDKVTAKYGVGVLEQFKNVARMLYGIEKVVDPASDWVMVDREDQAGPQHRMAF